MASLPVHINGQANHMNPQKHSEPTWQRTLDGARFGKLIAYSGHVYQSEAGHALPVVWRGSVPLTRARNI